MGVIYGILNFVVAIWFYSSAASVQKKAIMWAGIGAVSFLLFKVMGYSLIAVIQGMADQSIIDGMVEQGFVQTDKSAESLSNERFDDQSTAIGIIYEFIPLIFAFIGTTFIRAKFILNMGFVESLKHNPELKVKVKGEKNLDTKDEQEFFKYVESFVNWCKSLKKQ